MKTVLGRVVSSKPVSLSKAARILSKFVSSDNGASPAFAAYLKRASASFDELVQFHKELKCSSSEHKGKMHLPGDIFTEETVNSVKTSTEGALLTKEKLGAYNRKDLTYRDLGSIDSNGVSNDFDRQDGSNKGATKKKKKRDEDGINGEGRAIVENGVHEEKKHKKSNGVGDFGRIDPSGGGNERKKHKKKRNHNGEERESDGNVEIEESDKKENRKRKHKESDAHEGLDDSHEEHRSKKKRKKHEVED